MVMETPDLLMRVRAGACLDLYGARMDLPWSEPAVVVLLPDPPGQRELIREGTLAQLLTWVEVHPRRRKLQIFMHERTVHPFSFDQQAIDTIIQALDRPYRSNALFRS